MIKVGVVNNMQDSALHTTERQFRELLAGASHGRELRVTFFSIPELPRERAGREYVEAHYQDIRAVSEGGLDGLIVTGTDPRGSVLAAEPYYQPLTSLVDWAAEHTVSTVWSCLAAHAAVQHLDGVSRQRMPQKIAGVFDCSAVTPDALIAGLPPIWRMPHSRHNTLSQDALMSTGYQMLSVSPDAGADLFLKRRGSTFLFVQGHPEYDPGALLREYRRDIGRFLAGDREHYPDVPANYFDAAAAAAAAAFRETALRSREIDVLEEFPFSGSGSEMHHSWHAAAEIIYSNWLSLLAHDGAHAATSRTATETSATHPL